MNLIPIEILKKAKQHPDLGKGMCGVLLDLGYYTYFIEFLENKEATTHAYMNAWAKITIKYREHLCQSHDNTPGMWWDKDLIKPRQDYIQKLIDNHPNR